MYFLLQLVVLSHYLVQKCNLVYLSLNNYTHSLLRKGNKILSSLLNDSPLSGANFSSNCSCGKIIQSHHLGELLVMYGQKIAEESHPFLALLLKDDKFHCGGTVINSKYVLTAAHCFKKDKNPKNYTVKLGVHNRLLDRNDKSKRFAVINIVVHEQFEKVAEGQLNNDVALMELDETISFNPIIQPICLPNTDVPFLKRLVVQGWGKTEKGFSSAVPMQAALTLLTSQQCLASKIGSLFGDPKTHLCAEDEVGDACAGDSGGPLLLTDSNKTNIQIGIVSSGKGCANAGYPGIYTNVLPYIEWIHSNTKNSYYCNG